MGRWQARRHGTHDRHRIRRPARTSRGQRRDHHVQPAGATQRPVGRRVPRLRRRPAGDGAGHRGARRDGDGRRWRILRRRRRQGDERSEPVGRATARVNPTGWRIASPTSAAASTPSRWRSTNIRSRSSRRSPERPPVPACRSRWPPTSDWPPSARSSSPRSRTSAPRVTSADRGSSPNWSARPRPRSSTSRHPDCRPPKRSPSASSTRSWQTTGSSRPRSTGANRWHNARRSHNA